MHVHRSHRIGQGLILILVDQRGAFWVVNLNHCRAAAGHGRGRGEEYDDLRPALEDMDHQIVTFRMPVKGGDEVTAPAPRKVRDSNQPHFVHKALPPKIFVEKGVECAVESHAGRSIRPPGDREVHDCEKFRRHPR